MAHGLCPICGGLYKLVGKGETLARHGFRAFDVRHGSSGGYHMGGHGGDPRIGTIRGNFVARRQAEGLDVGAERLAALPAPTREEAIEAIVQDRRARRLKSAWDRQAALQRVAQEEAQFREEAATSRHDRIIESTRQSIADSRALQVQGMRDLAELLRELIKLNPALTPR